MRSIIFIVSFLAIMLQTSAYEMNEIEPKNDKMALTAKSPVDEYGQLQVKGRFMLNQHEKHIVLRGVSMGWHNWWGQYYNSSVVDEMYKNWNINIVRASMGVGDDIENSYLQNPEYALQCVDNVVNAAINNGIYVIIDFHSHQLHLSEAKKFFAHMSQKYGRYPNIIYEIFNEPIKQSWQEVKTYAEAVIDTIRTADPDNIILVGTPHWDQDIHLAAADPIKNRENIMYTLHFYSGTHKKLLRDRADAAIATGLPVFVSECAGMEASGDGPINEAEWNIWVDWMETNKISWVTWSMSAKAETCSMLTEDSPVDATQWMDTNIKPWGVICKERFKTLNKRY